MRQLLAGVWMIGIGVPLVNAIRFVGVIHVSQRVVYGYGFDLVLLAHGGPAEATESPHEHRGHLAATIHDPVLQKYPREALPSGQ